jgi:hypothetical protein
VRPLARVLVVALNVLVRLGASAVFVLIAAKSVERGGAWYALAALLLLLAVLGVLMAGVIAWAAWRHPQETERP